MILLFKINMAMAMVMDKVMVTENMEMVIMKMKSQILFFLKY